MLIYLFPSTGCLNILSKSQNNFLGSIASAHTFLHSFLTMNVPTLLNGDEFNNTSFAPDFPTWSHLSLILAADQQQQINEQQDEEQQLLCNSILPKIKPMTEPHPKQQQPGHIKNSNKAYTKPSFSTSAKRSASYCFVKRKFSMSQIKVYMS